MDWLDSAEKLSRAFSFAAVPVVLGVGGWLIQRRLQNQTIRRDYVQLAVAILENPDTSKVPPELREWAVDLLMANSPTKLNAKAVERLKSGAIRLPSFRFAPSDALTPGRQAQLEASLSDFQKYLEKLGFTGGTSQTVSVEISPGTVVKRGGTDGVAFWDDKTWSIVVASSFSTDLVSVLRQLAHKFLTPGALPSPAHYALESGLATYFPCSFSNNPLVGDQASDAGKRVCPPQTLRNHRRFDEIQLKDWSSVQNDGSEIWGGTFWQIREVLEAATADRLLAEVWQAYSSSEGQSDDAYADFARNLLNRSKSIENGKHTKRFRAVFEGRGLQL